MAPVKPSYCFLGNAQGGRLIVDELLAIVGESGDGRKVEEAIGEERRHHDTYNFVPVMSATTS